jgi:hypothetical protein
MGAHLLVAAGQLGDLQLFEALLAWAAGVFAGCFSTAGRRLGLLAGRCRLLLGQGWGCA